MRTSDFACSFWVVLSVCVVCILFVLCGNSLAYGQDFFYVASLCVAVGLQDCVCSLSFQSFCLYCITYATLIFHATPELLYLCTM